MEQLPRNMFLDWTWESQIMFRMLASWIRNFGADGVLKRSELPRKCASYQSEVFDAMIEDQFIKQENGSELLSSCSRYKPTQKGLLWMIKCVSKFEQGQLKKAVIDIKRLDP